MASIETVILTTPVFKRRVPFSERRSSWNIPYVLPVDCRFECFSPPCSTSPCQNGGTAFQVNKYNSYGCLCVQGIVGEYCEKVNSYFSFALALFSVRRTLMDNLFYKPIKFPFFSKP